MKEATCEKLLAAGGEDTYWPWHYVAALLDPASDFTCVWQVTATNHARNRVLVISMECRPT